MCHARQSEDRPDCGCLTEGNRTLGYVGGVITDSLQVASNLQRREDLAQIARYRLPQGQEANRKIVELALQLVDLDIAFDNARGKLGVARHYRLDRGAELAFGKSAHFGYGVA